MELKRGGGRTTLSLAATHWLHLLIPPSTVYHTRFLCPSPSFHPLHLSTPIFVLLAGALPEPILGCIVTQLVSIIERLHVVCGCIHNDIDARNVFVCTNSGIVRLSNYYFSQFPKRCAGSCLSAKADQKIPRFLGPLLHQAPERMLGLQCSFSSDIWSLGFLIRFCLTGELPVRPEKHQIQTLLGYKKAMVEGKLLPLKVNPREKGEFAHAAGPLGKATPRHIRKILEKTSNEWKESWKV